MYAKLLISLCFFAAALPASAQQAPVMKEGQVTENALVDALTPAEQPIRTRSIRVIRDEETGGSAPKQPAKRAAASLLITFETNSAALTPRAKRSLDVVGQALASEKLASFRFGIEGHADPRGGEEVNLKLSQARAESVRDYLVTAKQIDIARLEPVGKGATELLNKASPAAPENRRVTIVNLSK
jgi:OOP family OmpA-OmpF porin